MQRALTILTILGASLVYVGPNYWAAHWFLKWTILLYILSFFISFYIGRMYSWYLFVPVLWTIHESLYVWGWLVAYGSPLDEVRVISATSLSTFLIMLFFFLCFWDTLKKPHIKEAFFYLCELLSVILLGTLLARPWTNDQLFQVTNFRSFLGNGGMTGCLIATLWPFTLTHEIKKIPRIITILIPVAAIFLSDASQPIGVFLLALSCCIVFRYKDVQGCYPFRDPVFIGGLVFLVAAVLFGCDWIMSTREDNQFFSSSGRFAMMHEGWKLLRQEKRYLAGFGLNLSTAILPMISADQINASKPKGSHDYDFWMWFHSDWFQTLFEMGLIGFLGYANLFWGCLKKSVYKDPYIFTAVLCFGAMCVFNFPVHQPIHALTGCLLVWLSLV